MANLYHGYLPNPWIYSFYSSLERFSARKSSLAIYDRHASRVTAPRPSAEGGDVSVCWRKCITETSSWLPSPFLKGHWQGGPGFRLGWTSCPLLVQYEIMRPGYTAELLSKTLPLLQHRNGYCQLQEHWESQQEWTFSDPLLAFFVLHSSNQIWKDLVIKKHEIERKMKELVK